MRFHKPGIGGDEVSFVGFFSVGNSPDPKETKDMVNPVKVEVAGSNLNATTPPLEMVLLERFPVIERELPQLSWGIEFIGGASGGKGEVEKLGVGFNVDTIGTEEDGDVSFEEDVVFFGALFYLEELGMAKVLDDEGFFFGGRIEEVGIKKKVGVLFDEGLII